MHTKYTKTCFIESDETKLEKAKYQTYEDALNVAETVNHLPTQVHPAVPFKCNKCNGFHLYLKK